VLDIAKASEYRALVHGKKDGLSDTGSPPPAIMILRIGQFAWRLYSDTVFLALVPPVSLTFDYSMTFLIAESQRKILGFEGSPVVRLVLANHFMVAYFLLLFSLYFLAALAMLWWLRYTRYYPYGVAAVLIIALAHILGGFSWVMQSSLFSAAISLLITTLFLLTALLLGRDLILSKNTRNK